jgi:hypothetical protein
MSDGGSACHLVQLLARRGRVRDLPLHGLRVSILFCMGQSGWGVCFPSLTPLGCVGADKGVQGCRVSKRLNPNPKPETLLYAGAKVQPGKGFWVAAF